MGCGVPCAVTDVRDSVWIVVGETGRVVPPGDPEALADAWAELISIGGDGRRTLGTMGR
jgi:glycosyltransferase involved in cell wall biosynthesis